MLLYAVTDRSWLCGRPLKAAVEEALRGGVTMVQLREKDISDEEFLREALEIKPLCERYGVPFIINDNVKVALLSGADGVHVGQTDMDIADARRILGDNKIVGVSVQTTAQAIKAEKNGADYLGVGAVFNTSTKIDADFVPYDILKEICAAVSIPVCAIGGISRKNIGALFGSGVDGVALVSAIFASEDIERECEALLALSKEMVGYDIERRYL